MTVRFLKPWNGFVGGQVVSTLDSTEENRLIGLGFCTRDINIDEINQSRNSAETDSGKDPLRSTSASAVTYTLFGNITSAARIRQDGAGVVSVVSDSSVTMIGAGGDVITLLSTTGIGSMILIEPIDLTVTPKMYLVIKGGA